MTTRTEALALLPLRPTEGFGRLSRAGRRADGTDPPLGVSFGHVAPAAFRGRFAIPREYLEAAWPSRSIGRYQ
jgi:hypothetical protein